ncbi:MAG: electron transport complex subunit E [Kiritimatiellaeota bacterium]|nr:electron transport complex subunit E [Kiritimatiellota bacterium]
MSFSKVLTGGIVKENPTFRLLLGMCPTLAVTTSLENALGMGAATCFVLVCSNTVVSACRRLIPSAVRIPCYILLIASFVTVVEMLMRAHTPALAANLGLFIPLIVVNCVILGRAEAFAAKNPVLASLADGVGMGLGFTLALAVVGAAREALGGGAITVWGGICLRLHDRGLILAILPAGGFITLGVILGGINALQNFQARRRGLEAPRPLELDCRHCVGCALQKQESP